MTHKSTHQTYRYDLASSWIVKRFNGSIWNTFNSKNKIYIIKNNEIIQIYLNDILYIRELLVEWRASMEL